MEPPKWFIAPGRAIAHAFRPAAGSKGWLWSVCRQTKGFSSHPQPIRVYREELRLPSPDVKRCKRCEEKLQWEKKHR
jgi:hypothetical protein